MRSRAKKMFPFAIAAASACSPPPARIVENTTPAPELTVLDVPIEPATFHYCCKGGGQIEKPIVLAAGHWLLRVRQSSDECYEAVHPAVMWEHEWLSTSTASTPTWAATLVDVPPSLDAVPLRLRVFVEGGLRCCGTTTIDKVELVRAP